MDGLNNLTNIRVVFKNFTVYCSLNIGVRSAFYMLNHLLFCIAEINIPTINRVK